jgi:hypothetical protein
VHQRCANGSHEHADTTVLRARSEITSPKQPTGVIVGGIEVEEDDDGEIAIIP